MNNHFKHFIIFAYSVVIVLSAGCATPFGRYIKDRGNDLTDCFKADVGVGLGLDVQAQATDFVATGAGLSVTKKWGFKGRYTGSWEDIHIGILLADFGMYGVDLSHGRMELKNREMPYSGNVSIVVVNAAAFTESDPNDEQPRKTVDKFSFEVGGTALVVGARLGFSLGQLVDFILGWTGIDIGEDDASTKEKKKKELEIEIPLPASWSAVAASRKHNLAIDSQGKLWTWGDNDEGQLGNGTKKRKLYPTLIGNESWVKISAGDWRSAAIKSDNSLWVWGNNFEGRLGFKKWFSRYVKTPTKLETDGNWSKVMISGAHIVAIKTDGTLWSWGYNEYGQLGDGTNVDRKKPVQISNAQWLDVKASVMHNIALKSDGTLWAWGLNYCGQLGDGSIIHKNAPVQIGNDNDWKAIAVSNDHTVALKNDGTLWAWGNNDDGQLGDSTTISRTVPTKIGENTDWAAIAAGKNHTVALKSNGTLWIWGNNSDGQLGDGTTISKNIPIQIETDNNWSIIACGDSHTLAIKKDGSLWVWGNNYHGQLGIGEKQNNKTTPTKVEYRKK